jgi:hypothetical protein
MNALLVFLSDKSLTSSQAIHLSSCFILLSRRPETDRNTLKIKNPNIQVHLVVVAIIPVNTEVVADLHYYNLRE